MKTSIGIRANPSEIIYSIIQGDENNLHIVLIDKIVNPKSLNVPEQLKFLRNTLRDIIVENKVENACIRITESNARSVSIPRIYIEGVIQELIASSTITKYYVGQISSISAKLNIDRADFKPFVEGKNVYMNIDIWGDLSKEERESVMASISALNL
jgi:hypothetical protein